MPDDTVRLLAPFDPLVWDRRRFELLWGWAYRFEAYTPAPKRVRGYYALPLLWRDRVIGWGNLAQRDGGLDVEIGYVDGRAPRDAGFRRALADELAAIEQLPPASARSALGQRLLPRQPARRRAPAPPPSRPSRALRPPAPSATQPTRLGPTIWPSGEDDGESGNAGRPRGRFGVVAHQRGGRSHHRQEHAAEERGRGEDRQRRCALSTGSGCGQASSAVQQRPAAAPPRWRCSSPAHSQDEATTPTPSSM